MVDISQDITKSAIPFRLFVSFVISSLSVFCIGLFAKNVSLEKELAANSFSRNFSNAEPVEDKFSKIYNILELLSSRNHIISDTHVRTQHYAKPHTSATRLCPECGDIYAPKNSKILWVSEKRLDELRRIEGIVVGKPFKPTIFTQEPEEPIGISEELDSIITLLEGQASFTFSLLLTEMHTNHFIKKHNYPAPAGFVDGYPVGCPDCRDLYKKQTEPAEAIFRTRYTELLEIEDNYKNAEGRRTS